MHTAAATITVQLSSYVIRRRRPLWAETKQVLVLYITSELATETRNMETSSIHLPYGTEREDTLLAEPTYLFVYDVIWNR